MWKSGDVMQGGEYVCSLVNKYQFACALPYIQYIHELFRRSTNTGTGATRTLHVYMRTSKKIQQLKTHVYLYPHPLL